MTETKKVSSSPAPEAAPAKTAAPEVVSTPPAAPKKGMSTGAKVGLGLCGGCLVLLILLVIGLMAFPLMIARMIPSGSTGNFFTDWLETRIEDSTDTSLDFSDDEGNSYEGGTDLTLPSNFPSDIPQYSGASVTGKTSTSTGDSVSLQTSDTLSQVVDFY